MRTLILSTSAPVPVSPFFSLANQTHAGDRSEGIRPFRLRNIAFENPW